MKYFFFFLFAVILFSCTSTDKPATKEEAATDSLNKVAMADSTNYTTVEWVDSTTRDLGKIKEGAIVEISWNFKNTGNKPLIISNATAGCGCTIADKPREPVAPGQEGVIKARFNSQGQAHDKISNITKSVTVDANTKPQSHHSLTFTAQITKE